MSRGARIAALAGLGVLIAGVVLAQLTAPGPRSERLAGSSAEDPGPNGLLGLSLLLQGSEHPLERLAEAPSEGGLEATATAFLVDPGQLTAADAEALGEIAADGGRVVVAGDPGAAALERILGDPSELAGDPSPTTVAPLVPAPETSGIASVGSRGAAEIADPGPALPVLGAEGAVAAAAAGVGQGRVVLLADPSILQNELLVDADNARFALNLAGAAGRPVQIVEAVRTPPSSGLAALPGEWGWAFGGLALAGLAFAASRARRLGPPELASRPLPPPRRAYVDAMAAALVRTSDPVAAAEPLRAAARGRLARRAGLPRDFDDDELRAAAEAAGLEPQEVHALSGEGGADEMLAAGRALAKLG